MVGINFVKFVKKLLNTIKSVLVVSLNSFKSVFIYIYIFFIEKLKYFLLKTFNIIKYIGRIIKKVSLYIKNSIKKILYLIFIFIFPVKETRNSKGVLELCIESSLIYFTYRFCSAENYFDILKNSLSLTSLFITIMVILFITKRK